MNRIIRENLNEEVTFEQRPEGDGRISSIQISEEKKIQTEEATSAKALRWKQETVCLQRSIRENSRRSHQRGNKGPGHTGPCVLESGLALILSEMGHH